MDRQTFTDRLSSLQSEKERIVEQAKATIAAYDGAIQECSHWLKTLEEKEEPKDE